MTQLEELIELADIITTGMTAAIECIEHADYDTFERLVFPPKGEESLFDFMCKFDEVAGDELENFTEATLGRVS